ncbi:tRNA (adenosine(37)-N6)-threonylcarbamoyltransferase complex dimerization subunit type 1 TsaB [Alphaproteobacteria bacterium]|nr:tRNA (adenosine(37)-N6)-threonylcarbamoyltransferase complex dimerization subunit type 1 TsaB [Alphaproteobacteria bacterium]
MLILAFDTSQSFSSVAILKGETILAESIKYAKKNNSEVILSAILQANKEANVTFKDFDYIAVTVGPGSFTGVRVGIALAKAFKLSLKIPIIGISSLHVLAAGAERRNINNNNILVLNDAGLGEFFSQIFDPFLDPINKPSRKKINEIEQEIQDDNILITGNAFDIIKSLSNKSNSRKIDLNIISKKDIYPSAKDLAKLSLKFLKKSNTSSLTTSLNPLYLRPHYAKIKNSV